MKTETIDVLYKGTGGERIRLMKEEKHSEAVIKAEVTCTTVHEKTLPLLFFLMCVETSGKNMLKIKENFSILCSKILL